MQNTSTTNLVNDEPNILTVAQASTLIQRTLNQNFNNISVKGEISSLKRPASGHIYFDLKDETGAVLNGICWRGNASRIKVKLEDGLEVIASGNITTYPQRSNYQLIVSNIEVSGIGTLMAMLEERKKKLAAEGLFDPARKKPLPFMPQTIGIVTSPTGAVIRDILHRLEDRFPVQVYLYPTKVQGEGAAEEITKGIEFFNNLPSEAESQTLIQKPDLLIVARGGGSIEDLWPFNEENVVRAVAASEIPFISAIGHETDTTLIDYASDRRAPTPTAAAEMAVPVRAELQAGLMDLNNRLFAAVNKYLSNKQQYLIGIARGLVSPNQVLQNYAQRLDDLSERLQNTIKRTIRDKQQQLAQVKLTPEMLNRLLEQKSSEFVSYKKLLESYSYKNVLSRGYSVIRNKQGGLVTSSKSLNPGDIITLELKDGKKEAEIINESRKPSKKNSKPKAKAKNQMNSEAVQGTLL